MLCAKYRRRKAPKIPVSANIVLWWEIIDLKLIKLSISYIPYPQVVAGLFHTFLARFCNLIFVTRTCYPKFRFRVRVIPGRVRVFFDFLYYPNPLPEISFSGRVITGRVGYPDPTRTRPELLSITHYLTRTKKRYPKHL